LDEWGKGGDFSVLSLEYEKDVIPFQSSSGMEDKERRLWPGRKLDELSHEVGSRKKFPVGSSISSGGFSSDDLEDNRVSPRALI
jgi:hypothetical protein